MLEAGFLNRIIRQSLCVDVHDFLASLLIHCYSTFKLGFWGPMCSFWSFDLKIRQTPIFVLSKFYTRHLSHTVYIRSSLSPPLESSAKLLHSCTVVLFVHHWSRFLPQDLPVLPFSLKNHDIPGLLFNHCREADFKVQSVIEPSRKRARWTGSNS